MENPIIYCYTATGNSYAVAKEISHQIGSELLPITHQMPEIRKPSAIGFVFPTYLWVCRVSWKSLSEKFP